MRGIGPVFKLIVQLQNTGAEALTQVAVVLSCEPAFYTIQTRSLNLPMLVPGVPYEYSTFVHVCFFQDQNINALSDHRR